MQVRQRAIEVAPLVMMALFAVFLMNPATRPTALWMLKENHPIEVLTFAIALIAGILGLALAWRLSNQGEKVLVFGFYAVFSLALIFLAMEEIAWGQQFLGFASPESWRAINVQGETTLHNIAGIQGRSEIFRLVFGLGGLAGVWLSFRPRFRKIGSPIVLLPWFAVIALHAGVDTYNDFYPIAQRFDYLIQRTSELVEMQIAFSGLLYILLNAQAIPTALKERHAATKPRLNYSSLRWTR